jgi:hypothetical protein
MPDGPVVQLSTMPTSAPAAAAAPSVQSIQAANAQTQRALAQVRAKQVEAAAQANRAQVARSQATKSAARRKPLSTKMLVLIVVLVLVVVLILAVVVVLIVAKKSGVSASSQDSVNFIKKTLFSGSLSGGSKGGAGAAVRGGLQGVTTEAERAHPEGLADPRQFALARQALLDARAATPYV